MKNIPVGWQIQVTSWENDGDYYNTEIISGLSETNAKFYIEVASLFGNKSGIKAGNCYDSDAVEWDKLSIAFKTIVSKYPKALAEIWQMSDEEVLEALKDDDIKGSIQEISFDVIGGSEYFTFRKFESYKAYYFPTEIKSVDLLK